jgi:phosphosulfolactate phosphohydrolase-like enzyme
VRERGQTKYQVRFGWGAAGAARIARDAHLLVWVDVLPTSDPRAAVGLLPDGPEVVLAGLGNASAVADRVLGLQADRGDRCIVAVVGAGIDDGSVGGGAVDPSLEGAGESTRDTATAPDFAVEDFLAAGAVVDALAERGIDASSPEAAAACAAYTGLRRAVRHLVSASVSATMLEAAGRAEHVERALEPTGGLRTLREQSRRA